MRQFLMDVRPLRASADFRRLWLAGIFSGMGSQLASFAVLFYVWRLTGSVVWTGMVGLARMLPMLAAALVGGALADSRDRRRLVMVTRSGQIVTAALLTVDSATGGQLWAVLLLVGLQSGLGTVGAPASKTFVPKLLPPRLVSAGIALFMISFQASMLIGPSVAGLIVAQWGVTVCFAIDTVTSVGSLYGVLRLPPMPPEAPAHGDRPRRGLRAVGEGMALVVRTPVVRAAMLADLVATVPAMPISLFPLINAERFGDNPRTLGLFMTALAVGGVLATAFSGTYTRLNRQVVVMLVSVAVWGGALLAFGLVSALWATLLTLAVAGAADSTSVVSRGTVVQLAVPDRVRGRVNSLDYLVGVAGPELGNVRGGLVAGATSGSVATIIGGGMAALGAGLIALLVPVALRFSAVPSEPGHEADNERGEDGAPEPGDGAEPHAGGISEPVAAPANPQRR
jgi:MFS family permease